MFQKTLVGLSKLEKEEREEVMAVRDRGMREKADVGWDHHREWWQ